MSFFCRLPPADQAVFIQEATFCGSFFNRVKAFATVRAEDENLEAAAIEER